jgi:hypothetical protein
MSPAQADQITRIIQFDGPIYDLPGFVLRVEINLAMGIGPYELRNDSLQSNAFRKVVPLGSVVCHNGAAHRQKTGGQGYCCYESTFHPAPHRLLF